MGNNTRYEITVTDATEEDVIRALAQVNPRDFGDLVGASIHCPHCGQDFATIERSLESAFEEPCKWYDHERDMLAVSAKIPQATIRLEGEGEESGDIWRKTFKGGALLKGQKARIVFDD